MNLAEIQRDFRKLGNAKDARLAQRFCKTGPGEYGEGDQFLGIRVPVIRTCARRFRELPRRTVLALLKSRYHEERLLALIILVAQFRKGTPSEQRAIYEAYLSHTAHINNWDLVDSSAEHIVGAWLFDRSKKPLNKLVRSESLWERRIAIMATFHFIKKGEVDETLRLAERLLQDEEDLIHKAVGWMLRETGRRDRPREEAFLDEHVRKMPRTMLRYAIEHFSESRRKHYLRA